MTQQVFLSETEPGRRGGRTMCVVCNRPYNEREQGWTYSSSLELYTCSNECHTSERYEQLLIEQKKL